MKRREVLKSLGFGVTAGLVLPGWLSSCSKEDEGPEIKYDGVVGIVGAGASGLAVADYLISKGIKVKIFEASGRVGGRIRSVRPTDPIFDKLSVFNVELGADRIFGTDSEMGKIVSLLKVPTTKFNQIPSIADYYIIDNEYYSQAEVDLRSDFTALNAFKSSVTGAGSVQDAADAAGISTDMQGILNAWLGNAYGSSVDRIGANGLGEALNLIEHDNTEFTLTVNPIGDVITSRYDKALKRVQLNRAVKAVSHNGEAINLTILNTSDNSETTETVTKLVVTSSVAVLKDLSLISFLPDLPTAKRDALNRIGMDASIRVILEFKQNTFFHKPAPGGKTPAFIYGGVEVPALFFSGSGKSGQNLTVSLTINGSKAEELSILTDAQKIDQILDELDVVFDGEASDNIRKYFPDEVPPGADPDNPIIYIVKDWSKEIYIGGGQSYPMIGGTNADREVLAEPIDQKIFFAGEAADVTGEFGTISGAIKSGERAALEVVTAILAENEAS